MKTFTRQTRIIARAIMIGLYFINKAQTQARNTSIRRAALNLKKQGVPLDLAVQMLCY